MVNANAKPEPLDTSTPDPFFQYDRLFLQYGLINGVPWVMLKAICMNESSLGQASSVSYGILNPSDVEGSKSSDGKSWGLMQMTLPTAMDFDPLATPQKLNDPDYSVRLSSLLLKQLITLFDEEEFVVKAYNEGQGNARKELAGQIDGYAQTYWERYQRNKDKIVQQGG